MEYSLLQNSLNILWLMWNIIYLCHDLIKMMRFLKYISKCHQSIEPSDFLCHSLYNLMCYLNSYSFWSHSKTGGDTISLGFSNILIIFLCPKLHIQLQHKYYYNFSHLLQFSLYCPYTIAFYNTFFFINVLQ